MADNFSTKDATDTTITGAADDIGGILIPRIKLVHGADGTNDGDVSSANGLPTQVVTALPAGTNNVGDVDVATIAAGETHVGKVGGETVEVAPTVTVSASPNYSSGDSIGGKITLTSAIRVSGGTAILQDIVITDKANQQPAGTILIFNADPSAATITDNSAFAFSTDITKLIATIPVVTADYTTIDSIATANLNNLGRVVKAASGTSLYAAFVTTTAANLASTSDIGLRFKFLQD